MRPTRAIVALIALLSIGLHASCKRRESAQKVDLPAAVPVRVAAFSCALTVTLAPERSQIHAGDPVYLLFQVAPDCDDELLIGVGGATRNSVGRNDSYSMRAVSASGDVVDSKSAGESFGGATSKQRLLRDHAFEERLLVTQWLDFTRADKYAITVSKAIDLYRKTADGGALEDVTIPVHVVAHVDVGPPE
jgi:hypothetical protein